MSIPFKKFYPEYDVESISDRDIPALYAFCKENSKYFEYMKSEPTARGLTEDLYVTPPGISLGDKHFVGFYEAGALVAILDLISGYPSADTAFIGWFMTRKSLHGTGLGSQIISVLLGLLRGEGFSHVQLGCIKENVEAEGFWRKHGFLICGDKILDDYTVSLMRREL